MAKIVDEEICYINICGNFSVRSKIAEVIEAWSYKGGKILHFYKILQRKKNRNSRAMAKIMYSIKKYFTLLHLPLI